jgi:hypothetical protein
VQGVGLISISEMKSVLPALTCTADHAAMGRCELTGEMVLVRIALFCSYTNSSITQLCNSLDVAKSGVLLKKQVLALMRLTAKGNVQIIYCTSLASTMQLQPSLRCK